MLSSDFKFTGSLWKSGWVKSLKHFKASMLASVNIYGFHTAAWTNNEPPVDVELIVADISTVNASDIG